MKYLIPYEVSQHLPKTIAGRLACMQDLLEISWSMIPWYKKLFINKKRWMRENAIQILEG